MARAASPALSDNEVDISKSLFQDDGAGSDADFDFEVGGGAQQVPPAKKRKVDVMDELDDDEDEAFIAATQASVNRKSDNKAAKKAGAFQSMGLNTHLLKAITRKGFSVPTPIQRKTIPLIMDGQDVVGMARTGSGKTAAFVIPMIEKLKSHSAQVGARAIVLSPSRELALQTLKVVKEMGKGTDLRTTLLVGGDSLEEQFSSMASNPDIVIATPGRFEHLKVEMRLELSSVKYVVFDEADRLFEMGFAAQLAEIMHSLPSNRQTMLFSATLPKSLVEFARAGLQEPRLVRLDAESKIAPGLQSAFFTIKRADKEGALLDILHEIIKMPTGLTEAALKARESNGKKRKRDGPGNRQKPSSHSTVVFAATKHHVEYLAHFLKAFGFATSYVYGALDQTARKMQVEDFRSGMTNILVVTDVAARGLDIPVLANVINYDFPSQPKIYVHRVGRTARAGEQGWSYSLITQQDLPYLLDLQLFLSRKLLLGRAGKEDGMFKDAIVVGTMVRDKLERYVEEAAKIVDDDIDLAAMRGVALKGEKQYLRTRNSASAESVKRSKKIAASEESKGTNMLLEEDLDADIEQARQDMLARVSGFRPTETIFELGRKGATSEAANIMRNRRAKVQPKNQLPKNADENEADGVDEQIGGLGEDDDAADGVESGSEDDLVLTRPDADMNEASEDELDLTFTKAETDERPSNGKKWQDSEHFMSYTPSTINMAEDRGYGVQSGGTNSHFITEAQGASMDLAMDDSKAFAEASKAKGMRWDKKSKKYVARANDEDGSKGKRFIISESGQKLAASFRSGRFDAWKKANKVGHLPRVGEAEKSNAHFASNSGGGKRYKHHTEKEAKAPDKYRDDYHKQKAKFDASKEAGRGKFAERQGKNELRGVDDVRKLRREQEKRKDKNARPQKRRN